MMQATVNITGLDPEDLYSVRDVCELLGMSQSAAYEYVYDGRLPSQKVGHARVITGADIMKFLRERVRSRLPNVDVG